MGKTLEDSKITEDTSILVRIPAFEPIEPVIAAPVEV